MNNIQYTDKLEKLASRFHIYCVASPTSLIYIDVYDMDKYGEVKPNTGRRYRAETFAKAVLKAYYLEFENKLL